MIATDVGKDDTPASETRRIKCKRFLRAAVIITAPCFVALVSLRAIAEARPSIVTLGGSTRHAGAVAVGSKLTYAFRLHNPHAYPVEIEAKEDACGCEDIALGIPTIPPYGDTTVELSIRAAGEGSHTEAVHLVSKHAGNKIDNWLFVQYTSVR